MSDKVNISKVKYIVKVLTKCSGDEADRAANKICRDPEASAILALACGGSIYGINAGYKTASVGFATGAWPAAVGGLAITGISALAAKRFCLSVVNSGKDSISKAEKETFKNHLP